VVKISQILDLALAMRILVNDCCSVKEGENVLILGTTDRNRELLDSVMAATLATGANASMMITNSWPRGVEPWKMVAEAMKGADLLINFAPLFNQQAVRDAQNAGCRIASVSRDVGFLKRGLIGVDYDEISKLHTKIANVLEKGKNMRVTTEAGTDITMDISGRSVVRGDGVVREPGEMQWLPGSQLNQAAIEESANGTLVFDWSLMPIGTVKTPVKLTIKEGRIVDFEGGEEADEYKKWMESLNDERMYWLCHYSFGLNPNYKLNPENESESERVMGVVFFGFGSQLQTFKGKLGAAAAHSDCIMKNATVTIDGKILLKDNKFYV